MDDFVDRFSAALAASAVKASGRRNKEQSKEPDHVLASELAGELANTASNPEAFVRVVERLRDPKLISAQTLAAVANQFLGKAKHYRGRKAAIEDIVKRQKLDARSAARGKALDRVGV